MTISDILSIWSRYDGSSKSWWCHQMETSSALLAIGAGNPPVTGEFPTQRPVTWSFDVFFDLRLNKRLSKQLWGWWFETSSHPLWCHCNVSVYLGTWWHTSSMMSWIWIYMYNHSPMIHVFSKFDNDIFVHILVIIKNVVISFIKEYKGVTWRLPSDIINYVITMQNTFSGLIWDNLFMSEVRLKLWLMF